MLPALTISVDASPSPAPAPVCRDATGFAGTICVPVGGSSHPAIVFLGGSEGGNVMGPVAAAFATYGYVAASVAYFGLPGLPQTLQNIPVETVTKAIDVIAARPDVDLQRIAIYGGSRGGELALLTASTDPRIHAVIADVPSPFAWQGLGTTDGPAVSSWTLHGTPVPFVSYTAAFGVAVASAAKTHAPLALRPAFDDAMSDHAAVTRAFFPLERIAGPVLLFGAGDDQLWDSEAQARLAFDYLHDHRHPYADVLKIYPLAGHGFAAASPGRPFTTMTAPDGSAYALGGTEADNLAASADMRGQISAFLSSAFFAKKPAP